jgi:hypothetical protein
VLGCGALPNSPAHGGEAAIRFGLKQRAPPTTLRAEKPSFDLLRRMPAIAVSIEVACSCVRLQLD